MRPSVGCREYLTRVVYKLLPALDNDLSDWLVETRVKASSLLFIIMSHMEESSVATQHADKILNLMLSAAKDDEVQVVKNVSKRKNNSHLRAFVCRRDLSRFPKFHTFSV